MNYINHTLQLQVSVKGVTEGENKKRKEKIEWEIGFLDGSCVQNKPIKGEQMRRKLKGK